MKIFLYIVICISSVFFLSCSEDVDESTSAVPYSEYMYFSSLYLSVSDKYQNDLLVDEQKVPFEQIRIDYEYDEVELSEDVLFTNSYIGTYHPSFAYYSIASGNVPVIYVKNNPINNPNPNYLYNLIGMGLVRYPLLEDFLPNSQYMRTFLASCEKKDVFSLPLNFYYDGNKEASMFVTWQKEDGTVSTDKITCKWLFEENIDFLFGVRDVQTYKQFLRPAQIYINDELKWDINDYKILETDSDEDKVAKNQISLYPYIELVK